jgi:hypothetical protein
MTIPDAWPSQKSISQVHGAKRFFSLHPDEPRRVFVTIGTFVGHGTHVHVVIREENEPIWDAEESRWIIPAHDPAGEGTERMMKFHDRKRAIQWVKATFETEFSKGTHVLIWKQNPSQKWFYKEGD